MKIGNVTLTVDGDILSMDDDRGVGTRMNREAAAELWPAIKRFAKMGWIEAPAEPSDPPAKRGNKHRIRELEARVLALEKAANFTKDVQMPVEEAVKAAIASSGLPEFTFPEHEMAPATAWVLTNEFGSIMTRFRGMRPKISARSLFEIAFFDSQAEAEGVHDAMGLRGTVRPQLVNRRTLEPV